MKLTENFTLSEFECRCGCPMPAEVRANVDKLAGSLQALRDDIHAPIRIVSGYRCASHNAKVGGAPRSRHIAGDAGDIQVEGWTGEQLRERTEDLIKRGKMREGGLGTYKKKERTLHYDTRGRAARWRT